jgi:uncharacterized protein (TIGR00730 family)
VESDLEKAARWEELEEMLRSTVSEHHQKATHLKLLNDIFKAAIKLAKESPGTLNLKIATTVLKEIRYSFKMFYPHRHIPKITMFGSARVPPDAPLYEFSKRFAMEAVKRKFMIITGGGPGIMAAGNEGAEKAGFGLNIKLPVEQTPNPFIDTDGMLINYKYFFTRKLFLVKEACAFAFFPGGFGTFDEAFEVLTLLQTGKSTLFPIVMLEPKGYGFWTSIDKSLRENVLQRGFISESDFSLYHIFHSAEEAMDHIQHFYRNYHSMRFVKNRLVLRLQKPLSQKTLDAMNKKFGFLAPGGKIEASGPLPEESNEPEIKTLPRLVFPFDRRDYGGLRRHIEFINHTRL